MDKVHQLSISAAMAIRIKHIYKILGYQSVADFVQGLLSPTKKATMDKLPREESRYDEIQQAIESGEYQKWQEK